MSSAGGLSRQETPMTIAAKMLGRFVFLDLAIRLF
jgi:hypothetical protein